VAAAIGDDVRLEPRRLPDPLMDYVLRKAKGAELRQLRGRPPARPAAARGAAPLL